MMSGGFVGRCLYDSQPCDRTPASCDYCDRKMGKHRQTVGAQP